MVGRNLRDICQGHAFQSGLVWPGADCGLALHEQRSLQTTHMNILCLPGT